MTPEEILAERKSDPMRAAEREILCALMELTKLKLQHTPPDDGGGPLDVIEGIARETLDRLSAFQVLAGQLDKWPALPADPKNNP